MGILDRGVHPSSEPGRGLAGGGLLDGICGEMPSRDSLPQLDLRESSVGLGALSAETPPASQASPGLESLFGPTNEEVGTVLAVSSGPAHVGSPGPSHHGPALEAQDGVSAGEVQAFLPPPDELPASRDRVDQFLIQMTERPPPPILPPPSPLQPSPAPATTITTPGDSRHSSATEDNGVSGLRCSGRLAAKPTAGLPSMEKARLVLLRREGIYAGDGPPTEAELQRYKDLYKSELPPGFIAAVKSLAAAAAPPRKKKSEKEGTIPAAVASQG